MKKLVTILLIVVCAVLATGGSFTCTASSGDGHPTTKP